MDTAFRKRLTALRFDCIVGITGAVSLWPEGQASLPPKRWSGRGRKLLRRDVRIPAKMTDDWPPRRTY